MSETFKKGDRVHCTFLGLGTVTQDFTSGSEKMNWLPVLFDTAPPIAYNMGTNPTHCFVHDLTKIVEGEMPIFKVHLRKIVEYTEVVTVAAASKAEAEKQGINCAGAVDWKEGAPEIKCDYVEQVNTTAKKTKGKK